MAKNTGHNFNFSVHAIEQMSLRLGVTIDIDTRWELMDYIEPITNKDAYEIVGDPTVLSERNKKTSRYYALDFDDINVQDILYENNYDWEALVGIVAVLVVREGCCVTFKTNRESEIFGNLKEMNRSSRVNREKGFRRDYVME